MTGIRDKDRGKDDAWMGSCAPGLWRMGRRDAGRGWLVIGRSGEARGSFWNGRFGGVLEGGKAVVGWVQYLGVVVLTVLEQVLCCGW